jgi:hypothetical protein
MQVIFFLLSVCEFKPECYYSLNWTSVFFSFILWVQNYPIGFTAFLYEPRDLI